MSATAAVTIRVMLIDSNVLFSRRLSDALQVSVGWVKRAAREGDPVATRLVEEIDALLGSAKRLDD